VRSGREQFERGEREKRKIAQARYLLPLLQTHTALQWRTNHHRCPLRVIILSKLGDFSLFSLSLSLSLSPLMTFFDADEDLGID